MHGHLVYDGGLTRAESVPASACRGQVIRLRPLVFHRFLPGPAKAWRQAPATATCVPASARASAHVRRMRAGGRSSAVCVYRGGNGRGTGAQKAKPLHPVDAGALRCKSLTMTYFHRRMPTIIGAKAFHDPVRDGKAWDHLAMVVK